ncbi:MAG TPA: D-2-hydroxyacid dehydrogenase [bacterium]|nr:D-2-hydroxyacid dehydrogenase [bacterium]
MGNDSGPVILLTAALDEEQRARLLDAAPGARILSEQDLAAHPDLVGRIEVAYPRLPSALWARAAGLRWLQTSFAGVDGLLANPEARRHPAVLTNVHIHVHCLAEHLWGMALMLVRNLHGSVRVQQSGHWDTQAVTGGVGTLAGGTLCVAGLGAIGAQCAAMGRLMGMRVIGINRSGKPHPSVDQMVTPDKRREVFAVSSLVMLLLPGTEETRGFAGKAELEALHGAWLVNGGRGTAVDTNELVRALEDGRVRGAGLDVTDPEPLPDGHPLWALPNVVISPHYGGVHPGYEEEALEVFRGNLRRWVRGEPLQNVVDKSKGY